MKFKAQSTMEKVADALLNALMLKTDDEIEARMGLKRQSSVENIFGNLSDFNLPSINKRTSI